MKNKFLSVLLTLLFLVFCCCGCNVGSYLSVGTKPSDTDSGGSELPPDVTDPDKPTELSKNYVATLYLSTSQTGTQPFLPKDEWEITVIWRSKNSVVRVPLGADGKADAGELDGSYTVYLSGLPEEYSYDPNGYVATAEQRQVSILITDITLPTRGNGSNMYVDNGCYTVSKDGTYRATIVGESRTLFYEYKPSSAGIYAIESLVNIYDDNINPIFHLYSGSTAFKWFTRTLDGGGASSEGGFTKNFKYEFAVDKSEVGNVCTFAVGAVSKSGEYPVNVDFNIRYLGEYTSSYADIRPQAAKELSGKTPEKPAGTSFIYADFGTMLFDASKFRISPNTGMYHVYDSEKYANNPYKYGAGYGPMLMCDLTGKLKAYTVIDSLYKANNVGINGSNYLMLYNMWIEAEQKFATFDYTNFIRIDYYGVRNSDGKCYVTEELRTFLQKFAENHSLYTDGVGAGDGTPEIFGYTANQDALWLFACGFYE